MKPTIRQILDDPTPYENKEITVGGKVRTHRQGGGGNLQFISLQDGTVEHLQCFYDGTLEKYPQGTSLSITGTLIQSPAKGQTHELKVSNVELIGRCDPDTYPLPRTKDLSFATARQYPHLRQNTVTGQATAALSHGLAMATFKYFDKCQAKWFNSPTITTSDCEGAGEAFLVVANLEKLMSKDPKMNEEDRHFFRRQAYLTVSGQLQGEAGACSLGRIFTFGPTFRAEESDTSRHASEFIMVEPEFSFFDLGEIMAVAIGYIKYVVSYCFKKYGREIAVMDKQFPGLLKTLETVQSKDFAVITYTEAIDILQKSGKKFKKEPTWGIDLGSEHEQYLCEKVFGVTTVITHYPRRIKAFYMHEDPLGSFGPSELPDGSDCHTVACMDILVPGIGEIVGGSQREIRYDVLKQKMDKLDLHYEWYLDLRKYGTVPHSGFGLGFARLLRLLTGHESIRDVIPFPVYWGKCSA